jgi:AcrR family transcriptional regulator
VIAERGVAGTRLADVAERIGVSPPAVLYWFDSKEQLLAEALVADENRFYEALGYRLSQLPDPADRLSLLISSAAGSAEEFALWLELWAWSLRDPTLADARERLDDRWRKEIEEIVRDGQAAGAFGDIDPGEAALSIASLLDGLTVQVRLGDAISAERMVAVAAIGAGRLLSCALDPPPPIGARDLGVETGA